MFCDALTVAAVADELRHKLVGGRSSPLDGGRIQQILAVDQWVVGVEVYANHQRHYLLLSARPQEGGRIHLIPEKLRRGLESPTPLLLRLRKCADGGHLTNVRQEHLNELVHLPETRAWQPTIALRDGTPFAPGGEDPTGENVPYILAYAPYCLTQYAERQPRTSISEAMAGYYLQEATTSRLRRDSGSAYAVSKNRVEDLIAKARERQTRRQEALLRAQPSAGMLEGLRHKGQLLLAYAQRVSPGQTELVVTLSEAEPPVRITLDPTQSPIENAQEYFRRYEKAKSAAAAVPGLLADVREELAYLDQVSTDLDLAEDQPGIAAVESALSEAGHLARPPKGRRPATGPLRVLSQEGFVILVGRNSWQNEEVTFHLGAAHDLWLHAQGVPGAHVLVRTEGREVPAATLEHAAQLAARFSAARHSNNVPVDYTLKRNVHRCQGGRPGQVTYRGQRTIVVRPALARVATDT